MSSEKAVLHKQKLIIITGSPCVGKTTVTDKLFTSYENNAFFDGDWAWCVNPFSLDDPRLRNGDKTMSFALSNYLDSGFDYVFFSSVVVIGKEIREAILKDITAKDFSVILIVDRSIDKICDKIAPSARKIDAGVLYVRQGDLT
ncbi:MAG: hypothetical protein K2N38_15080 [Oscillospiraceae bacterium]|nr:hypothetical protein [Oscillospiraceae bacterium]